MIDRRYLTRRLRAQAGPEQVAAVLSVLVLVVAGAIWMATSRQADAAGGVGSGGGASPAATPLPPPTSAARGPSPSPSRSRHSTPSTSAVTPSVSASASAPSPTPEASSIGANAQTPDLAMQAILLDDSIFALAPNLRREVARQPPDTVALAQLLRKVNTALTFGLDLASRLAAQPDGATVGGQLLDTYRRMRTAAVAGLAAPLADAQSYRDAAAAVLEQIAVLDKLHASLVALASPPPSSSASPAVSSPSPAASASPAP